MKRTKRSAAFKAKVALEANKELNTLTELASKHQLHPVQISKWKQELIEQAHTVFATPQKKEDNKQKELDIAYKYIGQLLVELDWLKKKLGELA